MLRRLRILVAVLGVLAASVGSGQPIPREKVPQQLSPWIPWALDGHEELLCPKLGGAPRCYWPGRLALTLNATGGTFSSDLVADRALLVPLPGHALSWPQDVKVDGQAVPVTESGERPFVFVSPGAHRIDGRFVWKALPDSLPLSEEIALVDLSVDGKVVPFPGRDGALLLLSRGSEVAAEEDALRLKVFRKLSDGIPLFLETRVELEVAGKAREITLPGVLPEGAVPISVDGDAAARVDKDGALRIQVRAGKFAVSIDARLSGKPESVGSPKAPAPWPDQEIWVFEANELLRQVEISGGTGMDASRTDLPEEWRRFPTYLLAPGEALAIREARRGEPELAPDQIALRRSMWLALDGSSLAVRDAFTGTVGKTSRLDLAAPGELGRASVAGQDQVITASPETKRPGVELRTIQVSVGADSTVPRTSELPAVGWSVDVTSLGTTLYLPPGWRLLAAPGTDRANGAWTSRWTLFAFFFVLVVAVATARLVSKAAGVLALLTLVLCYGERGAPQAVWFFLVAATALVVLAKEGKLAIAARVFWGATALILVIIALPYFVREVRMGLYPAAFDVSADASFATGELSSEGVPYQEAGEGRSRGGFFAKSAAPPAAAPAEPQQAGAGTLAYDAAAPPPPPAESLNRLQVTTKSGGDTASTNLYRYEVDSNALVQTGKGIPQWQRGGVSLEWSGPVSKEQKVRLLLLSPFANLVLSFLRVALVTLLALSLVAKARPGLSLAKPGGVPAMGLALLLLGAANAGAQEIPETALLDDLRTRLLRTPPCGEACVTTPDLSLTVKDGTLTIDAEVHAGAPGSWPLPGPAATWVPRGVLLDGKPSFGLVRFSDGFLHLRIPAGVHRVSLSGPLPSRDSVALEFSATPKRARATAPGWQVDGIREDGTCDSSVQLSRMLKSGGSGLDAAEAVYEPWFEVVRTLDIGVTWRVETVINRVTPAGAPAVLKVPMLKGMLATGTQEVKDGEVIVSMGRDQEQARWSSTLPPVEGQEVTLRAPEGKAWSEVWIVKSSPLWQIAAKGIAPVKRQEGGLLLAEFRPWPGEEVTLVFRKPAGVPGETLTLDGVTLEARPGKRLSDASLTISARASRSGPLAITLPKGAEIQSLTIDGTKKAVRPDGDTLTLTIDPGRHQVVVTWQTKQGITAMFRQPRVKLSPGAVNVFTVMHVPEGRWVLLAGGPRWGPSVLFWGELLVILLAAFLAGRIPLSPLRSWQWVLLALGLSQIPLVFGLIVAGWFFVFAAREKGGLEKPVAHNVVQVFLVGWTLVFLVGLYATVHQGLLLRPDMQITGNGSNDTLLRWYVDRIAGELPAAWTLSVPLWVYKGLMLAWALWLATSLVKWLGWGFRAFSEGGGWKEIPPWRPAPVAGAPPPPPPPLLDPEPVRNPDPPPVVAEEEKKGD